MKNWMLFGYVKDGQIVIEQVDYIMNPVNERPLIMLKTKGGGEADY